MIKTRFVVSVLLSTLFIAPSLPVSAQQVDISGCRAIEDRLERFDCYETLGVEDNSAPVTTAPVIPRPTVVNPQNLPVIRRPVNNTLTKAADDDAAPATASPAQGAATVATSDVDQFGKKAESANAGNANVVTREDGKTELFDTVAELTLRRKNLWLITLASGQQWLQMESKRYALKEGDEVRIYPTIWGNSYRLSTERLGSYIQVQRVD